MKRKSILVVDDEEDILELVKYNLSKNGFEVLGAVSGELAIKLAQNHVPDLIILDLMLPGMDGLEVCRILKSNAKTKHIPVIMLTAKGEESDVITGLELGAEDYITKPFGPKILVARVRAVMRRRSEPELEDSATIKVHDLIINPGRHEVLVKGKPVELTVTEFRVLHFLARRPGWVFRRSQIVDAVKGSDYPVTERSVDVQIVGLRKKLDVCGNYIETVRGVGYRFKE